MKRGRACGTRSAYQGGCRCEPCRAAERVYNQERRARLPHVAVLELERSRRFSQGKPGQRQASVTAWRERNPEKVRGFNRATAERFKLKRYGMSQEQYQSMHDAQGGLCAICGGPDTRRLSIDHDHESGDLRGLLCRKCNLGIGCFEDNPEKLQRAIGYLAAANTTTYSISAQLIP